MSIAKEMFTELVGDLFGRGVPAFDRFAAAVVVVLPLALVSCAVVSAVTGDLESAALATGTMCAIVLGGFIGSRV